jgi:hypothetical protein
MKTLLSRFSLFGTMVLLIGCLHDDTGNLISIEDALGENDYVVYRGVLTFRDQEAFGKVMAELRNKSDEELNAWEEQLNFKSLRSIHATAIQEEETFLNEKAAQFPGNTTLTRKELGYTKRTTDFINKGLFVINEFETVDMNVTLPVFGSLVNEAGVVGIGNNIIMPQLYSTKIIKDGDYSKIKLLTGTEASMENKNIEVYPVKRNMYNSKFQNQNARTKAWTSCSDAAGKYKTIAYEEYAEYNMGGYPCVFLRAAYWIRFRSLKKVLGSWHNHDTSQWSVTSSVTVDHYKYCEHDSSLGLATLTYLRNIITISSSTYALAYGNDVTWYYFNYYDLGPCNAGGLDSCVDNRYPWPSPPEDPWGQTYFTVRSHEVNGKNGAYCHLGE